MSGLVTLRARAEALRWAADQVRECDPVDAAGFLLGLAGATEAALAIVEPDYPPAEGEELAAEEHDEVEPEEEEPADEEADAAPVAIADEAPPAAAEPAPIASPKPRPAVPTPQAVIRAWALKEGIAVNTRGHVSTEALERINARRAEQRLPPFGAKPSEVEDA